MKQLHEELSIYDKSGVIGEFEDEFARYHDRRHGLLFNSGTSAILAMFEGVNLGPETEVLCPVYTFHASVTPMAYLGARPIFCDVDDNGNVCLAEIERRRTPATTAVVMTHMWGVPVADTVAIAEYCAREGLALLEDCSHAHGAEINKRKVGTFGDGAAWSLQGQKIITGGEGGILLTDSDSLYARALVQGHYNKRPQKELAPDSGLRDFYLTGMGLKLRSHPLAVAIAREQFGHLEQFRAVKQRHSERLAGAAAPFAFLHPPLLPEGHQASWYAFNLRFDASKAGITRERFVAALVAEGLVEVDIPGSTGLLNQQPLFTRPHDILPRLYPQRRASDAVEEQYPSASNFYNSIIKLPVWAFEDESPIVDAYVEGIAKVSEYVVRNGGL